MHLEDFQARYEHNTKELVETSNTMRGVVFLARPGQRYGIQPNLQAGGWSVVEAATGKQVVLIDLLYTLKEAIDIAHNLSTFGHDSRGFQVPA